MATWNRALLLPRAIDSVITQTFQDWELVVVDDGSTDETQAILARYARDPRIRVFRQTHGGASAARNFAFAESRADIITYLDSDNEWYPNYLETTVRAFAKDLNIQSSYSAVRRVAANGTALVHFQPFDFTQLQRQNFIDLNVFAHRRVLWDTYGGFDPALPRLSDWDLIRRFARHGTPHAIATVGVEYYEGDWPRITNTQSAAYATYLIMRKDESPVGRGLKVLYPVRHHGQLSGSGIKAEIARMRRWGVEIEAWSETPPGSTRPSDIRVHWGPLKEAVRAARPHILHLRLSDGFERYCSLLAETKLPITIRVLEAEQIGLLAERLKTDTQIGAAFAPPQRSAAPHAIDNLCTVRPAFDPRRYGPSSKLKNRKLVLYTSTGSPTEDLPLFIRFAKQLPEFRFALAIGCDPTDAHMTALEQLNEEMGRPVDLRVNLRPAALAAVMQRAAIYCHTFGRGGPSHDMPAVIAEAMASGAYIIAQRQSVYAHDIGDAGRLYDDELDAARLLRETLDWPEDKWQAAELRSIERAFTYHVDSIALRPILDCWLKLAGRVAGEDNASTRVVKRPPGLCGLSWRGCGNKSWRS